MIFGMGDTWVVVCDNFICKAKGPSYGLGKPVQGDTDEELTASILEQEMIIGRDMITLNQTHFCSEECKREYTNIAYMHYASPDKWDFVMRRGNKMLIRALID